MRNKLPITTAMVPRLIENHDAMAFALVQHAEMYRNRATDAGPLTGQEAAVVALDKKGAVIGMVAWEIDETDHTAWVNLVAVHPSFRQMGVFTRLWPFAMARMKANFLAKSVRLGVAHNNSVAQRAYQNAGLFYTALIYEMKL